jgi:hypothetical protein
MRKWKIAFGFLLAALLAGLGVLSVWPHEEHLIRTAPTAPTAPCRGVKIREGDDLAAVANAAPKDTTFCISGFHRLSTEIVPKDGQRFIGVGRAVLNGSKLLTTFSKEGGSWMIAGQTQDFSQANPKAVNEPCMVGYEGCHFPEDVYFDDKFLQHVPSLKELKPGTFFFDYKADKIYLADDPVGHKVEASIVRRAISNTKGASNVVVRGLVVEEFSAYAAQDGVIGAFNGANWVVEDNEIRLNHGSGVMVGQTDRMIIRDNRIDNNGCGGIMGSGATSLLIEGNEIAFNNALSYNSSSWSCGGGKLVGANGVVFRKNDSHDNNGFGFWTDAMNLDVVYEDNRFVDNSMGGVMHEINDGTAGPTVILHNVFLGNGFSHPHRLMLGAAIVVSASNYVEIAENMINGNANGITLNYTRRGDFPDQDLTVHDISVHDNVIGLRSGDNPFLGVGRVGFYTGTIGGPAPTRIAFVHNHYFLGDPATGVHFSLPNPGRNYTLSTAADWQAAGFDTSSEFRSLTEFPSNP